MLVHQRVRSVKIHICSVPISTPFTAVRQAEEGSDGKKQCTCFWEQSTYSVGDRLCNVRNKRVYVILFIYIYIHTYIYSFSYAFIYLSWLLSSLLLLLSWSLLLSYIYIYYYILFYNILYISYVNIFLDIIYLRRLSSSGVYLCICIWHVAYHTFVCLDIHDIYIYVCVLYTICSLHIITTSLTRWSLFARNVCKRVSAAKGPNLVFTLHVSEVSIIGLIQLNSTPNHAQPRTTTHGSSA